MYVCMCVLRLHGKTFVIQALRKIVDRKFYEIKSSFAECDSAGSGSVSEADFVRLLRHHCLLPDGGMYVCMHVCLSVSHIKFYFYNRRRGEAGGAHSHASPARGHIYGRLPRVVRRYSVYLLYWYESYSVYLLYWYESTNPDTPNCSQPCVPSALRCSWKPETRPSRQKSTANSQKAPAPSVYSAHPSPQKLLSAAPVNKAAALLQLRQAAQLHGRHRTSSVRRRSCCQRESRSSSSAPRSKPSV
jgi:hypothetical protein